MALQWLFPGMIVRTVAIAASAALLGCTQAADPDNGSANEPASVPDASANEARPPDSSPPAAVASAPESAVGECMMQDGEELRVVPVKAIGTEPFWGVRVEGRCVTYSTPEDQKGTRIWTRFESGPNGPVWNGAFGGKRFQLYVQPRPNCSDGMSDKSYPLEARLIVQGEQRQGCAEPL